MHIKITASFSVGGTADLDAQTDALMDELLDVEEQTRVICDSAVSASLAERNVEISFVVDTDSVLAAQEIAGGILKQVIEGAGGRLGPGDTAPADGDLFRWEHSEQYALASV